MLSLRERDRNSATFWEQSRLFRRDGSERGPMESSVTPVAQRKEALTQKKMSCG